MDRIEVEENTRCLWKNPWWLTESSPPPLTPEELDPTRDICREQLGISPLVKGRRLLIRAPMQRTVNGMLIPEVLQQFEQEKIQVGFVLAVGDAAYPPSPTYGDDGSQVFCHVGDWVEYSYWEKTASILNKNSLDEIQDSYLVYYVNDLHVNSVIRPRDYPIILRQRC